jgi:nucleotide-binding universal stress UspA family protein
VAKSELDAYRRDEGQKALADALARLEQAGVPHDHHIGVGAPGATIAAFAQQLGCTQIVMGSRGRGGALGALLGSVATAVLRDATVPVTVVK